MEKQKSKNVAASGAIDYTDQLKMSDYASEVMYKYCASSESGDVVTVNFQCKCVTIQNNMVRLADLPDELASGAFFLWFTVVATTPGNPDEILKGWLNDKTISSNASTFVNNATYHVGLTFVRL